MKPFALPKQLQGLSDAHLAELNEWLDEPVLTYKVIREKLFELHGIRISDATLTRYNQRRELAEQTIDHDDSAQNIRAFIAIQNAQPVAYDTAGLALIQKRAFDAACAPKLSVSQLAALQRVFHYKTARADAERRHAQNEKRLLQADKRNELLERSVKVRELESAARAAKANPAKKKEDNLGPLIRKPEDILARARKQFGTGQPPLPQSAEDLLWPSPAPDPNPSSSPALENADAPRSQILNSQFLIPNSTNH